MRIKLHQDLFAHKSGETVDVETKLAKWAVAEGYASTAADADGVHATSVEAKNDPRLAENVSDKPNDSLAVQHSNGLVYGKEDADPVTPVPTGGVEMVEVTNGKGDPEKAEKGKETLEEKAVEADSEQAVEVAEAPAA